MDSNLRCHSLQARKSSSLQNQIQHRQITDSQIIDIKSLKTNKVDWLFFSN